MDSVPQANVDPAHSKVEAPRTNDVISDNTSVRSKQKGKRKAASKQEQQEEKDVAISFNDAQGCLCVCVCVSVCECVCMCAHMMNNNSLIGGWKVQLSRQQLRVLREQQRQTQQSSHDHHQDDHHQDEAVKEETMATLLNENQTGGEDTAVVTADNNATDSSPHQKVEVSVHCDNPTDIERALKEAGETSLFNTSYTSFSCHL